MVHATETSIEKVYDGLGVETLGVTNKTFKWLMRV